ncbi:NADH:flavin oxidoreductase [Hujiaoplasma nucleasis]|uniref:NADH:flavin oxidoreductase n=1 Tax=Hujiaoplasma nucleasis TaxID=2725268 RepID=A0A7L6N6K8_9MOLU|nr:NADH:flavin oxidoreductase [Hujiaoplasma nucleasis]QLY40878.1 NADH:flavin oxidoreductase [Hujiaoplasma nucleasis]
MTKIFSTKKINQTLIQNRLVLPPMVTFNYSKEGFVNDRKIDHYYQIAKNGIGLIVLEATAIHPLGRLSDCQLGIWDDQFIPGLKQLVDTVHQEKVPIVVQIHHAGQKTKVTGFNDIVSASPYKNARGLSYGEVKSLIHDFKEAAIRAYKAGFDGVEIHGAHGYLLTQFFSLKSNQRKDEYGGSFENRIRIAKEIYHEVRTHTSPNFIIGIRMGCNENSLEESILMAKEFEKTGYDYLSVSSGLDASEIEKPKDFPYHWITYGGILIQKQVTIPVIGVYGIRTEAQIKGLIESDLLDFVALGRTQLADYNFTKHLKNHEEILYCLQCQPCRWREDGSLCPRQRQVNQKKSKLKIS